MDKFASLNAFRHVVIAGGFAAAARDMGLSRSQVNKLVIGLEDGLGVQLLTRTTRSVSPTPAGEAFFDRAQAILNDLAEAETAIQDQQDEPQGDLRVNAPMTFGTMHLGRAMADFMDRHPKIRVQLNLTDRFVDPVENGYDLTIRIAEPADNPSMIDHQIIEAKRVFCAAPDYLEEFGYPESPAELKNRPCLHYGGLASGSTLHLTGPDGAVQVKIDGKLCANNGEVLRDAALKGLGITLLPTFIVGADLQAGRLVTLLNDYKATPVYLGLLYAPHRHMSARIRLFVEFMYERFGEAPYWDLVE